MPVPPQYCYNEWLAHENEVDRIGASKATPDRMIECGLFAPTASTSFSHASHLL